MRLAPFVFLLALVGCHERSVTFSPGDPPPFANPAPGSDAEAILDRLEQMSDRGDEHAAFQLVFLRDWHGGDRTGATRQFVRLAEGGNVHAAEFLSAFYQTDGMGAARDFEEAARWLRVAADLGSERAADQLAHYERWSADTARLGAEAGPVSPAD